MRTRMYVVWEGRSREASPYPDFHKGGLINMSGRFSWATDTPTLG
jgi:hypothetical protein